MHTTVEPLEITIAIDAQHPYWMPAKERAIELAFSWLKMYDQDVNLWRETGAHETSDHSWKVGLAIKQAPTTTQE